MYEHLQKTGQAPVAAIHSVRPLLLFKTLINQRAKLSCFVSIGGSGRSTNCEDMNLCNLHAKLFSIKPTASTTQRPSFSTMSSTQPPKVRIRSRLTPFENLAIGAAGGALETTLQMPILTFKFSKQEGRPMPTTLSGWYRGVFVQAGTVAPITALQVMLNGLLGNLMLKGEKRELTDLEKMTTSAGAGAMSACVYGPVDLTTIQQQKLGLNPLQTLRHVMHEHGSTSIFRGFSACAVREAIYTAGYLGLGPVATVALVEGPMKENPFAAAVTGACFAGVAAGLLTHPFDTAKTCIQADMKGEEFRTARQTIPKLIRERGFTSLFRGGAARALRNCGAFYIVISLREYFIDYKTTQEQGDE